MDTDIMGGLKVKIFTFVKSCGIIVIENKKTEKSIITPKIFDSAF